MDEIHVMPVTLPAGTRFGAAEAAEITELGGSLPLSVGVGNDLTVTAAGARGVAVTVYAFRSADTTAPTVSSPTVSIRTGVTLGSRIAVRLAWTASDSGSGIGHFTVQRSVDGASWSTLASSLTGTSYSTSMASGHRYRYRVRAYDRAGNSTLSGWSRTRARRSTTEAPGT